MKRWILLLPLWGCLIIACGEDEPRSPEPSALNQKDLEQEVLSQIQALPEVGQLSARIHQFSSGRASLELLFLKTPSAKVDFYRIAAAENSTGRFRPVYQFHVYPQDDWRILYYDAEGDEEVSLKNWRKSLKAAK